MSQTLHSFLLGTYFDRGVGQNSTRFNVLCACEMCANTEKVYTCVDERVVYIQINSIALFQTQQSKYSEQSVVYILSSITCSCTHCVNTNATLPRE